MPRGGPENVAAPAGPEEEAAAGAARRLMLRPTEKKPDQQIADYITYFKRVCKVNAWTDEEAGDIFCALLGPTDKTIEALDGVVNVFSA